MNRRHWMMAGVAAAAGAAGLLRSGRDHGLIGSAVAATGTAHEDDAIELPADFWSRRFGRPEGGELVLAELRGKPLLVNFWATWCPPCVRELPEINRFSRDFARRGWQVVGIAVDSAAPVQTFLKKTRVSYPIGLAGYAGTALARQLGNTNGALPFTVLLDAEGRITQRKLGETSYKELAGWAGHD